MEYISIKYLLIISLVLILIIYLYNCYKFKQFKYYENFHPRDDLETRINNDYNFPDYYLIDDHKFNKKEIPFDNVQDLIYNSKFYKLYNQFNYDPYESDLNNFIGRDRGYINWSMPVS